MLRAIITALLIALVAALGCGPPSIDGGADAGLGPDASEGHGGLSFTFVTAPALSDLGNGVEVDEVHMRLGDLRAIGDSAPGDPRTSVHSLELDWRSDRNPAPLTFSMAPPGIYSQLAAHLGSDSSGGEGGGGGGPGGYGGYDIRGHVTRSNGETLAFEIEAQDAMGQVSVPLDQLAVGPQRVTHATIELSLAAVSAIDWEAVELENGELRLDGNDPRTVAVTDALVHGFTLVGSDALVIR